MPLAAAAAPKITRAICTMRPNNSGMFDWGAANFAARVTSVVTPGGQQGQEPSDVTFRKKDGVRTPNLCRSVTDPVTCNGDRFARLSVVRRGVTTDAGLRGIA